MSAERVTLCPFEELGDGEARRFDVEADGLSTG